MVIRLEIHLSRIFEIKGLRLPFDNPIALCHLVKFFLRKQSFNLNIANLQVLMLLINFEHD